MGLCLNLICGESVSPGWLEASRLLYVRARSDLEWGVGCEDVDKVVGCELKCGKRRDRESWQGGSIVGGGRGVVGSGRGGVGRESGKSGGNGDKGGNSSVVGNVVEGLEDVGTGS